MKTRLGALAIAALLAACSGQGTDTKSDGWQAQSPSSTGSQLVGAGSNGLVSLSKDQTRTLGNAPDKGELFTYANKAAVKQHGAYTLRPVRLSEEHAIRGVATGLMTVPAPDGSEIRIRYERHEEHPDGNWSWIGRVIGGDATQEAIFTFGEKAVFGSIPQAAGPALRLTTEGGIAYLMQADPSRLKRATRAGGDTKTRPRSAADPYDSDNAFVAMAQASARTLAKADVSTKAFTSANTIDLVAGYSNGFATARGSAGAAVTRVNNLVTVANQALLNSNVNARIRLVAAVQVTYADTTDNGDALEQLTGHNGTTPITPAAALGPMRTARDQYGADLVALVRDFQPQNNGCGIAWLNGANGANITISGDAPFGYSVISDGDYDQAGNTYFCEDITLVHEMAHNMGSAHDVANAGGIPGRYPYSYGYKTTAAAGNFFTVMAYGDDNQQLYRVFSNPDITTCGTRACGVANQADNARSLRQTIPIVAQFRATRVPIVGAARLDVNGDGRSDLVFRNTAAQLVAWWEMNGVTVGTKRNQGAGSPFSLSASGDFNGDGKTDLAWTNAARRLVIFTSTGTAFSSTTISNDFGAGWSLVGAGDINGDGKSDLIFRNTTTQLVAWWEMNGTIVGTKRNQGAGSAFTLVSTGDFNADGKTDLLWVNAARRVVMFISTGTAFTPITVVNDFGGGGWSLVNAGDINGDGKSDLIFRNAGTELVSWWEMNGAAVGTKRNQAAGGTFTLSSTGDFNGDGKTDLVWTNSARRLIIFTSNGTAFTSTTVSNDFGAGYVVAKGGA